MQQKSQDKTDLSVFCLPPSVFKVPNDLLDEGKTPKLVEILVFLMLLIVFATDCRYNPQGEWIYDNLTGLIAVF